MLPSLEPVWTVRMRVNRPRFDSRHVTNRGSNPIRDTSICPYFSRFGLSCLKETSNIYFQYDKINWHGYVLTLAVGIRVRHSTDTSIAHYKTAQMSRYQRVFTLCYKSIIIGTLCTRSYCSKFPGQPIVSVHNRNHLRIQGSFPIYWLLVDWNLIIMTVCPSVRPVSNMVNNTETVYVVHIGCICKISLWILIQNTTRRISVQFQRIEQIIKS